MKRQKLKPLSKMARAKLSAVQFGNEFDAGLSLQRQSWGFALWGLTRICAMNAEFATVVPHPAAGVMLARSRAAHRNELNSIPWLLLRFLEQTRGRLQRRTRLMSNGTELAGKRAADVASSNDPNFIT